MEKKVRIATAGDNCMDVYDKEGKIYPGGNPVNVAVYVRRLGGEAAYIGPVGTDAHGRQMMAAIAAKGVDTSHMKVLEGATAVTHVEIIAGDRVFGDYEEGVMADFKLNAEDIEFLSGYDVVVSGLWGMIEGDLPVLKEKGVTTAFDFATRPEDPVVEKAMPYVDYAFFAVDDRDEAQIKDFMRSLYEQFAPKVIVVTRGEKGSLAFDGTEYTAFGIIPCEVVDTMGAGDSFIAGFIYSICQGKTISEAMKDGAANSSVTIAYSGAW